MTNLAIRGHATRGKEIIEILEMLGGKNEQGHCGHNPKVAYYISHDRNTILCNCVPNIYPNIYKCVDYTLEEFLEKYPYKVGDKVIVTGLYEYPKSINFMKWFDGDIHYSFDNETWFLPSALKPYKETIETITIYDFKANTKEWLIDKLHGMIISNAIKTIGDIHEELHKPQYPNTYKECCEVLGIDSDNYLSIRNSYRDDGDEEITYYESDLLGEFDNLWGLTICRDAYWKIAGDWKEKRKDKAIHYVICSTLLGEIVKDTMPNCIANYLLDFPTAEMRDAFYENFKDLIETCKELL